VWADIGVAQYHFWPVRDAHVAVGISALRPVEHQWRAEPFTAKRWCREQQLLDLERL
jgi:hypothetical protein